MPSIPLPILLTIVVVGVTFVVLLSHLVGWSAVYHLGDEATARQRFLEEHPEARVVEVTLATDGLGALLELEAGAGLIFTLGDRLVTAELGPGEVQRTRVQGDTLELIFADMGRPRARLELPEGAAARWARRLEGTTLG